MLSLLATSNEKNGNGQYKGLRTRKRTKKVSRARRFRYFKNTDLTMQFDNAKDPIYFAFDCLDQKSVPELMGEFVKDSFFEIANFVSKVVKK